MSTRDEHPAVILTNGAAGNQQQARALAAAMHLDAREFVVVPPLPARWFAPRLLPGAWATLPAELRELALATPRPLVIGCGRAGAWATRLLRRHAGNYAIQILDPRLAPTHWDCVIAPSHDGLRGANVIATIGALNAVTPARLAAAALTAADLRELPHPRTTLLIGGDAHGLRVDRRFVGRLLDELAALQDRHGGSFLISTSRRSGTTLSGLLGEFLAARQGRLYVPSAGASAGPNPYLGFLALADRIVVTPESVNMLSEAAATGKPTYTVHAALDRKLRAFHRSLIEGNHLRYLDDLAGDWHPTPLRETEAVAELVWRRIRGAVERRSRR